MEEVLVNNTENCMDYMGWFYKSTEVSSSTR